MSAMEDTDLRAVRFADTVNDNLICCICQTPFIDPVISHCGHTFCSHCIHQSLESSSLCPIDRAILLYEDLQPAAKIISNMVNELLVYCPESEQGCTFIGQRQYIASHVKNDCEYTMSSCQLEECKELLLKKDLDNHVETCKYRRLECNMCKKKMCAYALVDHYDLCPSEIINCIHCDTARPRSEHSLHVQNCPQLEIPCAYAEFGCAWMDQRQYLEEHIMYCPYESIKNYLYKQQQTETLLRNELSQAHKENESLKRQCSDSKQHIETITNQLDLMFPGHFINDADISEETRNENMISENQRINSELENLSASIASLELKQNMALMTETFRLQEEIQSLRAICHGLRIQMHYVLMDRRTSSTTTNTNNANAGTGGGSGVVVNRGNDNGNPSRIHTRLDSSGPRQETKL